MNKISVRGLLEVLADFDEHGGASPGLVAWELSVDEQQVKAVWEHAAAERWLKPAGRDFPHGEQLYRLTLSGWTAWRERSPRAQRERDADEKSVYPEQAQ
jgi:hypothetical protein